jgi:cell division control protein 6
MVNEVAEQVAASAPSIRKAYINCMSIKSSKELYLTLLSQLEHDVDVTEDDAMEALQKIFTPKRKTTDVFLVVLDEIDHIVTLDLESLYRLFEWSLDASSRVALVGIANALDLTDRFLPRLKSRNLKPELLPFLPYTSAQIKEVITSKLRALLPADHPNKAYTPFFHPAAIELCSRKVSTQTGDLRRAFEICRRAIDLVESETRLAHENEVKETILQQSPSRRVLGDNSNLATSPKRSSAASSLLKSLQSLTVETAPRVSIAHLNKVTAAAFSNGNTQRLKTLNLQQKAALCALMALEKRNREAQAAKPITSTPSKNTTTAPSVRQLFETYTTLCKADSILHPLSSSEFREVVGSLETLSLVAPVDGKNGSFSVIAQTPSKRGRKAAFGGVSGDDRRIASCVGDKEIEGAVEGLGRDILRGILSGEALD